MSIKTRTVLGRKLSLSDYEQNFIVKGSGECTKQIPNATFIGFDWVRTADHIDDDDNLGVRAGGTPNADETLGSDLKAKGFLTEIFPPIENVDIASLADGRTRAKTMYNLGEEWMPVAKFAFHNPDNLAEQRQAAMGENTRHLYSKRADSNDFTVALVEDILQGYVPRDIDDVLQWSIKQYSLNDYYSNSNGMLTRICQNAIRLSSTPDSLVRVKERDEWIKWLLVATKLAYDIEGDKIPLLMCGGNRDEQFFTRWHIPALASGRPSQVILYVNDSHKDKAREKVKEFVKGVNKLHIDMFSAVGNSVGGITITPTKPAFEIIGIIPQLQTDFQKAKYEYGELVSYEEYMND
jgi:hypothetical protein|tara:strand:+ start:2117 stop:3169 length:1053 start_codon:yes stop_codon:yes gene_type:complete